MVGGVPPIRAMKARYFTDPRFTVRLLPPPTPKPLDPKRRPKDDWSTLIPVNVPPAPSSNLPAADDGGGKAAAGDAEPQGTRSEEPTSELQSLMRTSHAVFCLNKKTQRQNNSILLSTTEHSANLQAQNSNSTYINN